VNFFGHATIARTEGSLRGEPGYVLGSMLPDFASMAKLRLAGVDDPVIEAGVGLHHRTDVAFHGAPTFVRLMHAAQDELEDEGLGHGSAMAVAHVGVELLLDGCLADQLGVDESYRQALATENAAINWRQADGTSRWEYMRARIAEAPFPEGYKDPDFVATRLIRILAARPRLAIHGPGEPTVHAWAKRARPEVEANAATLLDEVCNRLRAADVGS
jgi:acyl carrier protein phosphodiesterase